MQMNQSKTKKIRGVIQQRKSRQSYLGVLLLETPHLSFTSRKWETPSACSLSLNVWSQGHLFPGACSPVAVWDCLTPFSDTAVMERTVAIYCNTGLPNNTNVAAFLM